MAIREIWQFDHSKYLSRQLSCFLAGGVSTEKDWQAELIKELSDIYLSEENTTNLLVYNPRKSVLPDNAVTMQDRVNWDIAKLDDADIYSFYFANDTMQGGSLFELGRYATKLEDKYHWAGCENIPLVITIEPDYCYRDKVIAYLTTLFGINTDSIIDLEDTSIKNHAQRLYKRFKRLESRYGWDKL